MFRFGVSLFRISPEAARRRKILSPRIADVGFGRTYIPHVRRGLDTFSLNTHRAGRHGRRIRILQQLLDPSLRLVVIAFAEVFIADLPLCIDEIFGGPVLIVKRIPDLVVAVQRNRIGYAEFLNCLLHVRHLLFEVELRRVHPKYHQTAVLILLRPRTHIGHRTNAVDTRVVPEVDEDHLPLQLFRRQLLGVDPSRRSRQAIQRRAPHDALRVLCSCRRANNTAAQHSSNRAQDRQATQLPAGTSAHRFDLLSPPTLHTDSRLRFASSSPNGQPPVRPATWDWPVESSPSALPDRAALALWRRSWPRRRWSISQYAVAPCRSAAPPILRLHRDRS